MKTASIFVVLLALFGCVGPVDNIEPDSPAVVETPEWVEPPQEFDDPLPVGTKVRAFRVLAPGSLAVEATNGSSQGVLDFSPGSIIITPVKAVPVEAVDA